MSSSDLRLRECKPGVCLKCGTRDRLFVREATSVRQTLQLPACGQCWAKLVEPVQCVPHTPSADAQERAA